MKHAYLLAALICLGGACCNNAGAALPSDLDVQFGTGGLVVIPKNGTLDEFVQDLAVTQDNAILVLVGFTNAPGVKVVKLDDIGTIDPAFHSSSISVDGIYLQGHKLLVQPDGKLLVGLFYSLGNDRDLAIARLNADGSIDGGFGAQGIAASGIPMQNKFTTDIARADNGDIYVLGGQSSDVYLTRFNSDGSLDTEFASQGNFAFSSPSMTFNPQQILIDNNDVYIVGLSIENQVPYGFVMKLTQDGEINPNFADSGLYLRPQSSFRSALISAEGYLLLAGQMISTEEEQRRGLLTALDTWTGDSAEAFDGHSDALLHFVREAQSLLLHSNKLIGISHFGNMDVVARWHMSGLPDGSFNANSGLQAYSQIIPYGSNGVLRIQGNNLVLGGATLSNAAIVGRMLGAVAPDADVEPDPVIFDSEISAPKSVFVVSNSVVITGIDDGSPISIKDGKYDVLSSGESCPENIDDFNDEPAVIFAGQMLCVGHVTATTPVTATTTTVIIGTSEFTFTSTTDATPVDTDPDSFDFDDVQNAQASSEMTSGEITISGIDSPADVSIDGGMYSVNDGEFTAAAGTVIDGDKIRVRVVSSATPGDTASATLTVGAISGTFTVTTATTTDGADTTPDPFSFTDKNNEKANTAITSNVITVTGIDAPTSISVSGGHYRINDGEFTANSGTVSNGDAVVLRVTSSVTPGGVAETTLTIGGVSDTFTVTTANAPSTPDKTPDAFSFTDQKDVNADTAVTSNTITVAGIDAPTAISITGGEYRINGGAFTAGSGTVNAGDKVEVRVMSSSTAGGAVSATLTIGGVSDTFTVTTRQEGPADPQPGNSTGGGGGGPFSPALLFALSLLCVRGGRRA